jgi:hypothetical protein
MKTSGPCWLRFFIYLFLFLIILKPTTITKEMIKMHCDKEGIRKVPSNRQIANSSKCGVVGKNECGREKRNSFV